MQDGKKSISPTYNLKRYSFLNDNEHLRMCIKAYMKANDISLRSIGRDLSLDPTDISNYVNKKKRGLSDVNILRICSLFNISISLKIEVDG